MGASGLPVMDRTCFSASPTFLTPFTEASVPSAGPQALGVLSEGRHPGSLGPFSRGGGHALSDEGCDVPMLGWPLGASNLAPGYDSLGKDHCGIPALLVTCCEP